MVLIVLYPACYSALMDLHRAGKQADWYKVASRRRNGWQRLAAASKGLLTIGNVLTLIGVVLVICGLWAVVRHHYWLAIVLLVTGRGCDLLDGWLANMTGTKSPLGEKFDATADKVETGLALLVLAFAHLVPWPAVIVLTIPHLLIAVLATIAVVHGKLLHPSRLGKLSMAAAWLALGGFVILAALELSDNSAAQAVTYGLVVLSVLLGLGTLAGYWRDMKRSML
jgi:phosphatidylglycerophosphate synthase